MRPALRYRAAIPLFVVSLLLAASFAVHLDSAEKAEQAIVRARSIERAAVAIDELISRVAEAESSLFAYLSSGGERPYEALRSSLSGLMAAAPRLTRALAAVGTGKSEAESSVAAAVRSINLLAEAIEIRKSGRPKGDSQQVIARAMSELGSLREFMGRRRSEMIERLRVSLEEDYASSKWELLIGISLRVLVFALLLAMQIKLSRSSAATQATIKELLEEKERYRALAARIEAAREEERAEIARNIHDDLGQRLTAIKMDLSVAVRRLGSTEPDLSDLLSGIASLADEAIRTVRGLAMELRPALLDQLGLVPALKWQISEFARRTNISAALDAKPDLPAIADPARTVVYRIVQEALTNVARHSRASHVLVTLALERQMLTATIEDDGVGFDVQVIGKTQSVGLLGMAERAKLVGGTVAIRSLAGGGTSIVLRVPVSVGPALSFVE